MRRKPLAAVLTLLSAALVLGGNALLDAGWGGRRCARSPTACFPTLRSPCGRPRPRLRAGLWTAERGASTMQREFQEVEYGEDTGSG